MVNMTLLSSEEMRAAEKAAFARGIKSYALMKRAGLAVAHAALARFKGRAFLVLAGPGNNGGDGFVAAQALLKAAPKVEAALMVERGKLKGDAARAMNDYKGKVIALADAPLEGNPVIIDALFGTGLARPITGEVATLLRRINKLKMDVVAVDIPSGVNSDTGAVMGEALQAALTITFAYKKYGHVLMPGRALSGDVIVADIGIEARKTDVKENGPALWQALFPWPRPEGHKYRRGHALVVGGPMKHAGAAKLAALACLRVGAGLVSIVCNKKDLAA
jgi:hydroxyethylthiazole kinase-like uncharacterized protein yjeF